MNQHSHRVGKCIICTLPLFCIASLSIPKAIAGGFDHPNEGGMLPENYSKNQTYNQTNSNPASQSHKAQIQTKIVTFVPREFNFNDWEETSASNDRTCKSDGFNTVCLDTEQAQFLGW